MDYIKEKIICLSGYKCWMHLSLIVVSTVVSGIPFARFPTCKCIPSIFGLSYEDVVEVQQNTMTGEGKSSDNDKTHNNEESNSPPLKVNFPSRLELFWTTMT